MKEYQVTLSLDGDKQWISVWADSIKEDFLMTEEIIKKVLANKSLMAMILYGI